MATTALSAINPTLLDLASRMGPDDKIAAIIEMLALTNPILEDMVMVEGNLPTGHRTTIRTGLPSATWRKLNYGVQPSKSRTAQVTDACGMLEAYAEVDKALAMLNGNTAAFRLSEDRAFLEALNQEMASTMIYGNESVDDAKFTGLAARYAAYDATTTNIGNNVVKASSNPAANGSDQTSIWLIVWGENTIHGIYPKGSKAGIQHEDLGEVTLEDAAGGRFQGFRSHYKWDMGLTVRDWRYGVRICNLDVSSITSAVATGNIFDALDDALSKIPNLAMGRPVLYCNKTIEAVMRKQARTLTANALTLEKLTENRFITMYHGIPFKRCDAILNTEAVVS
jgi:hypothetical protein